MAHNFRLTGNYYVSKDGSDGNAGTSPDAPKLTINNALSVMNGANQVLVVGSGVYSETISKTLNGGVSITIIGDGDVIIDGQYTSSLTLTLTLNNTERITVTNISLLNFDSITFRTTASGAAGSQSAYFINCRIFNCFITSACTSAWINGIVSFTDSIFINSEIQLRSIDIGSVTIDSSIFINSRVSTDVGARGFGILLDSYSDRDTILMSASGTTTSNFNFNNIQGKIIMPGGTYPGIALSFADHRTYYPTYNVQSISTDPLFNNAQNLDFTLQAASPHIRAASDYISNIGGTEYAKHYDANSTEFTSGATITDLTLQGDNSYTITSPATEGRIITAPLAVQSYPATKPLTGIIWNGSLEFNKSVTAGTRGNQNVPAYDTYTTGAGASPDRLKIKMRYSTQSASPTAGQWDNGGYWTVDTYQLVEVNVKPKVDSNGIGNGDYNYIEFVGLGDLVPTWIQLDIKLRNDYNP